MNLVIGCLIFLAIIATLVMAIGLFMIICFAVIWAVVNTFAFLGENSK